MMIVKCRGPANVLNVVRKLMGKVIQEWILITSQYVIIIQLQ